MQTWLALYDYSRDWKQALADKEFSLQECRDCGMKWHLHVIDDAAVATVYGSWADAEQARRYQAAHVRDMADTTATRRQLAKLVLRLQHLAGTGPGAMRLLDFGCGDGALLNVARALGAEPFGVDVSTSRSESARRDGLRIFPDLTALDRAEPHQFDAIVLSQVLEHVADPLALLTAMHSRLRRGGALFVATPNAEGITVPRDFHEFTLVQPVEHVNAFSPENLRAIGRRAGFTPVRRPSAFVTTQARAVMRAALNWAWQPRTTNVFFRAL